MFDINFNPIEPDTLYSRILTAKIFWMDNRQTGFDNLVLAVAKVPLTASIRILGNVLIGVFSFLFFLSSLLLLT